MGEVAGGKFAVWKCDNCGDITIEEISVFDSFPRFGWGCVKGCKTNTTPNFPGRRLLVKFLSVADFNSFFDFGPNLTGTNWMDFWALCERQWAEQFKFISSYLEPCDCGSSVCDECNPGWDQWDWRDEEPWDDGELDCGY